MNLIEQVAALEEENAWLRREMGQQLESAQIHALQSAFRLTPHEARIVLLLHANKTRPCNWGFIDDAIPAERGRERLDPYAQVKIRICVIRKKLGHPDAVETIWGAGFRLSPAGRALIDAALSQTQRAAA